MAENELERRKSETRRVSETRRAHVDNKRKKAEELSKLAQTFLIRTNN